MSSKTTIKKIHNFLLGQSFTVWATGIGILTIYFGRELFFGQTYFYSDQLLTVLPRFFEIFSSSNPDNTYQWTTKILFGHSYAHEGSPPFLHFPENILMRFVPLIPAMNLSYLFYFIISLVFSYLYLRELGLRPNVALFGAIAYTFSGPIARRYVHYNFISSMLTMPLSFWLAEKAVKKNRLSYLMPLALVFGNNFLSTHPQIVLYQIPVVVFYILFRLYQSEAKFCLSRWIRYISVVGLALLLAVGVASPYLLPVYQKAHQLFQNGRFLLDAADNRMNPLTLIMAYISPLAIGSDLPHRGGVTLLGHSWEWSVYIGVIPLFFVPLVFVKRAWKQYKAVYVLSIILFFSWLFFIKMSVGGWSFITLYKHIPVWKLFHFVTRFLFTGAFAIACLSAIGLEHFVRTDSCTADNRSRSFYIFWLVWGGILAVVLFSTAMRLGFDGFSIKQIWVAFDRKSGGNFSAYTSFTSPMFLFATIGLALILLYKYGLLNSRKLLFYLTVVLSVDLMLYTLPAKPTIDPQRVLSSPYFVQSTLQKDDRVLSAVSDRYYYTIGIDKDLTPDEQRRSLAFNLGLYYGIEEIGGYVVPLLSPEFYYFYDLIGARVPFRKFRWRHFSKPNYSKTLPLLRASGVNYVITDLPIKVDGFSLLEVDRDLLLYRIEEPFERAYFVREVKVVQSHYRAMMLLKQGLDFKNQAVIIAGSESDPPAYTQGEVEILERHDTTVKLRTDSKGPGFLVLTDSFDKEWKAYIDGIPTDIFQTNGIFRGIEVPRGRHLIEFTYEVRLYSLGKLIAIFSLALILLFFEMLRIRESKYRDG